MTRAAMIYLLLFCASCGVQTDAPPAADASLADHAAYFVNQNDGQISMSQMLNWTRENIGESSVPDKAKDMLKALGYRCTTLQSIPRDLTSFRKQYPNLAKTVVPESRTICLWTEHHSLSSGSNIPQIQALIYQSHDQIIMYEISPVPMTQD